MPDTSVAPRPVDDAAPRRDATQDNSRAEAPATPAPGLTKPPLLAAGYMLGAVVIALTQGLGQSLLSTNIQQIAGPLGSTTQEATWLMAAYLAPNVSLTLLLFKLRAQYGIRNFAEVAIAVYVCVSIGHLWADSFESALVLRFCAGVAAAPLASLAFLYMLEPLSPPRKLTVGLSFALTALFCSTPVAGLISPALLDNAGVEGLYRLELGLAMVSAGVIYLLPLASPPRAKVLSWLDFVSYGFVAVSLGACAIVFTLGRLYWWAAAPWLGWLLALGVLAGMVCALIELNRENPLLDIRWLASGEMLHFAGVLLLFRLMLSEQSSGAVAFFRAMGLQNEQMAGFYWVVLGSMVLAGALSALILKPERRSLIHALALVLLAVGSWLDSTATIQTRPEQMYLSQLLIGFSSGLYLPPAMSVGLIAAFKRGPNYLLSFIIVFLTTQKVGALLGSALFGSFVTLREQYHSHALVQHLTSADPLVAQRLQQYAGSLRAAISDPVLRSAEGVSLLSQATSRQAYALAYGDAFLATACLAAAALACLLLHEAWLFVQRRSAAAAVPA
ncbi:MFS transporter [Paroceanicella profunda]|uniref:MFS transporter n=1 Tax=Paroceanicella profunda TaxID=2579971 RepID=A0A5B8FGG9_9RHOB|nr:MFS transporter [Paroceanicella profunda]QDL91017.1 MFS transporter [Paroceanicella profunda]